MPSEPEQPSPPPPLTVPVCGIGASADGIEALQQFFSAIPDDLGLAYVVILHLAPDYKSELPAISVRDTGGSASIPRMPPSCSRPIVRGLTTVRVEASDWAWRS